MNWHHIRQQVLERDNYTCQNCGSVPKRLDVHHLIPRSDGGQDILENLVTFCRSCHKFLEFITNPSPQVDIKYIRLEKDVYDVLAEVGNKTETFSDVVKRLLEHYKKTKK